MTEQEIATLLKTPFPRLADFCKDPVSLVAVLNLAINHGIRIGQTQMNESYYTMMTRHDWTSIPSRAISPEQ